jgi:hypothetical protein
MLFLILMLVIDTTQAQQKKLVLHHRTATITGDWSVVEDTNAFNGSYLKGKLTTTKKESGGVIWKPMLPLTGIYDLYYWHPGRIDHPTRHGTIRVKTNGVVQDYTVNLVKGQPGWIYLGTNEWVKGRTGSVEIQNVGDTDDKTTNMAATAIKLELRGEVIEKGKSQGNQTVWSARKALSGRHDIYFKANKAWSSRYNGSFTIHAGAEIQTIHVKQLGDTNWVYLGSFNLPSGKPRIILNSKKRAGNNNGLIKLMRPLQGNYEISRQRAQTILGLGVEIQSDGFGPGYENDDPVMGVPHELVQSEKIRLAKEMLTGFRYLRLAMGLWFRGQTADKKNIIERYAGQAEGIREMMQQAGIEGTSVEYWSPPGYWKSTGILPRGGSIKSLEPAFLEDFGDALVKDLKYLEKKGIPVSMWGLQNEPGFRQGYPSMVYTDQEYYQTFKVVAPKIRKAYPKVFIQNDSHFGQEGKGSALIRADKEILKYVDGWTWHRIGKNSNDQIDNQDRFNAKLEGKPVFNNEFEYFPEQTKRYSDDWRMVNTAQSIMNWFTFQNAPTWYWLHALKPIKDGTTPGFALGVYRPLKDSTYTKYPDLKHGHFEYLWSNWYALAGFLKYMPWNSVRIPVKEELTRYDQRILCYETPDKKKVIVLTNRSSEVFYFNLRFFKRLKLDGYRYDRNGINQKAGSVSGKNSSIAVKPFGIEFWVEQ